MFHGGEKISVELGFFTKEFGKKSFPLAMQLYWFAEITADVQRTTIKSLQLYMVLNLLATF